MKRLRGSGFVTPIAAALDRLSPRMRERLADVDFLCGVDPGYVGLHHYASTSFADGTVVAYGELAHTVYPHHQTHLPSNERRTTVVLPEHWRGYSNHIAVVAHELGHALHGSIDFDHEAVAVTDYGRRDEYEAFADAFKAWVMGDRPVLEALAEYDPATLALFGALA